jgi:hypothetical protein
LKKYSCLNLYKIFFLKKKIGILKILIRFTENPKWWNWKKLKDEYTKLILFKFWGYNYKKSDERSEVVNKVLSSNNLKRLSITNHNLRCFCKRCVNLWGLNIIYFFHFYFSFFFLLFIRATPILGKLKIWSRVFLINTSLKDLLIQLTNIF